MIRTIGTRHRRDSGGGKVASWKRRNAYTRSFLLPVQRNVAPKSKRLAAAFRVRNCSWLCHELWQSGARPREMITAIRDVIREPRSFALVLLKFSLLFVRRCSFSFIVVLTRPAFTREILPMATCGHRNLRDRLIDKLSNWKWLEWFGKKGSF